MTLKEIKQLQEMGFTLEEIKNEYFTETKEDNVNEPGEAGTIPETDSRTETEPEKEIKKNNGDSFGSLKDEIKEIKNLMFKKYSSENKDDSKIEAESLESIFDKIIN